MLLFAASAHAEPVGLQFKSVKLPDLIEGVAKGILHRDYVMAPEVANSAATITLSIRAIERDQVLDLFRHTLAPEGVRIEERSGVLYFVKGGAPVSPELNAAPVSAPALAAERPGQDGIRGDLQPSLEVAAYHPKHRAPELLALALKAAGAQVIDKDGKRDFLVYAAAAERMPRLSALLDQLDTPPPSVLVKAALIEVTKSTDDSHSLYAALSLLNGKLGLSITPSKTYSNAISLAGSSIEAVLSAVEGDSRFRYLAEPQLKVVDGEIARLVVGQEVPVRGQTVIANNQTTQGTEYKTAGVVIEIEPRIMRDTVLMKVKQTVSDFVPNTTSGIDSPIMQKREAITTVTAADGELVMIAGMDSDKQSASESGLSFLPRFMRASNSTATNSQMLLLLQVDRLTTSTGCALC